MFESLTLHIVCMYREQLYIMLQSPTICQLTINRAVALKNTCHDYEECVEIKHYGPAVPKDQSWQIFICKDGEKVCSVNTVSFALGRKHLTFRFDINALN